jgi:cysteine desulfurase
MSKRPFCYFDYNATTEVAPEVIESMLPFLTDLWGNPSSSYGFGREVFRQLEDARLRMAEFLNADSREIIFTSCGTESNNTAIHSALLTNPARRHIVTTAVEHSATLKFCRQLQHRGYEVTILPVEEDGTLDLHRLEQSIRADTAVVSVMWANNETGVLFPVEEIAAICRSKGVCCHTDAVQIAGKCGIDVRALGVDMLSLSAHKFHAPKGVGLLYVRSHCPFSPNLVGGQQENGRRGGTENVAGILGMARAAELAAGRILQERGRVRILRDRLEQQILKSIPRAARNGEPVPKSESADGRKGAQRLA